MSDPKCQRQSALAQPGSRRIRLVHIITCLGTGGAQMMLYKMLSRADRASFDPFVVSLEAGGTLQPMIESLGIPVLSLGVRRDRPKPTAALLLARHLIRIRPDLVQTWMIHGDLIGGLISRFVGVPRVIWNIRHSTMDPTHVSPRTIVLSRCCAWLSHLVPTRIVCCSDASREVHAALGFCTRKMQVIPNGFELQKFVPDPEARASVRRELGLPEHISLVGLVGRFHAQKDHHTFLRAASLISRDCADVHFVMCGENVVLANEQLKEWVDEAGVRNRCHLLGRRDDMPRIAAALDVAASSSSFGEGFPNTVGEAMACGVPCVVTDVGDSAAIVADTGLVVPAGDWRAFSAACVKILAMPPERRLNMGLAARQRVIGHFDLDAIVSEYESLYRRTVHGEKAPNEPTEVVA